LDCPVQWEREWLTEWVTKHIIVDGSNIATEGRTTPSLAQLNEAVMSLMDEYKGHKISVVVDATFGHRISKKEQPEFEDAIANNELVAPPAGAVGRGDAFILAIADKAKAAVFSNDSFQEFHGKYHWLFDEGRLIGGKPVPLVGWVFVDRVPVRGATSRRSVKSGKVVKKEVGSASKEASKPMPVPKSPPPSARAKSPALQATPPPSVRSKMANEVMPFLQFVEKHPIGTKVKAVVDSYAANGITVLMGDIAGYVPLRNMATPIPRSARDLFAIGDNVALVVTGYTPSRRSVDLGVPDVVVISVAAAKPVSGKKTTAKKSAGKSAGKSVAKSVAKTVVKKAAPAKKTVVAKKAAPVKKAVVAKKAVAVKKAVPVKKAAVKKAVVKKTVAKKAAAKK
jgi:hypothetical protein